MWQQALLYGGMAALLAGAGMLMWVSFLGLGATGDVRRSLDMVQRQIASRRGAKRDKDEMGVTERLLALLTPIGRRITLPSSLRDLTAQIEYAGNPRFWTLENILAMKVFSVSGGGLLALYLTLSSPGSGLLYGLTVALLGYEIPDLIIRSKANNRQKLMRRSLADTLDLLTVTVEAGMAFDAALAQVSRNSTGPLASEFVRFLQEKQIGLSSAEALEALSTRTHIEEMKAFTSALTQAEKLGISVGPVLRELSKEMRIRRRQLAQERAQKVPIKILFPLIFFIFPVLFIVIIGPAALTAMKTL